MNEKLMSGGFVKVEPGIDHHHVMLASQKWKLISEITGCDVLETYSKGKLVILGSGQLVPIESVRPDETHSMESILMEEAYARRRYWGEP